MTLTRDAFCSYCGNPSSATGYPRICAGCKTQIWANPIPVSVVLVPVRTGESLGLLVVRRAIEPRSGKLALVGVLLFSVAPAVRAGALTAFEPNAETSERGLVFGPGGLDEVFAFPLHAEAARRFFAAQELSGEHGYVQI